MEQEALTKIGGVYGKNLSIPESEEEDDEPLPPEQQDAVVNLMKMLGSNDCLEYKSHHLKIRRWLSNIQDILREILAIL